jgi:hypothetical protein
LICPAVMSLRRRREEGTRPRQIASIAEWSHPSTIAFAVRSGAATGRDWAPCRSPHFTGPHSVPFPGILISERRWAADRTQLGHGIMLVEDGIRPSVSVNREAAGQERVIRCLNSRWRARGSGAKGSQASRGRRPDGSARRRSGPAP